MRFGWARLAFAVFVAAQVACSAIIGTRDLTYDANADGGGSSGGPGDGSSGGPGDGSSGGPTDSGGEAGPCVDTMSDGKNCGACGHDCLGGTCTVGKCQPVALKMGGSPRVLRLDATHVFYSDSNAARVAQMNKDGSGYVELALAGAMNNYPIGLAFDDMNVYWGGIDGFLLRCKIGGCANSPQVVATTTSFTDVALANGKLFWIQAQGPDKIFEAPVTQNGGPGAAGASNTTWSRVVADATYLYVTSDDKAVHRVPQGTMGTAAIVATGSARSFGIAVDDTNVYWTDGEDPATIDFAPKTATNATPTPIVAMQHNPLAVAVDQTHIYWANAYISIGAPSGSINSCSFTGCVPTPLTDANRHAPLSIAVDDKAIYWAEFDDGNGNGGIYRLAKP